MCVLVDALRNRKPAGAHQRLALSLHHPAAWTVQLWNLTVLAACLRSAQVAHWPAVCQEALPVRQEHHAGEMVCPQLCSHCHSGSEGDSRAAHSAAALPVALCQLHHTASPDPLSPHCKIPASLTYTSSLLSPAPQLRYLAPYYEAHGTGRDSNVTIPNLGAGKSLMHIVDNVITYSPLG